MDIDLVIKLGTSANEEGFVLFLCESYTYKLRSNLNIYSGAIECFCIEILNKHSKKLILNLSYSPPQGDTILFEKNLQDLLLKNDVYKKEIFVKGDFNINLLDYENNKKVQSFVNLIFAVEWFAQLTNQNVLRDTLRLQLIIYLQILI